MSSLLLARDALIEAPEEWGLRYVHPFPRMDGPQVPIQVTEVVEGNPDQTLTYSRHNMKGSWDLVPTDMIWHQESNTVAIVVSRIDHKSCRVRGVVHPDTDEEREAFNTSGGKGIWLPVFQGWLIGWELPSELVNMTELVDMTLAGDDMLDLMPGTRASGRKPWTETGHLDPRKMHTPATSRFLAKQRAMMQLLAQQGYIEDEEHVELPSVQDVKDAGGLIDTFLPIEPPKPEGKIISYEKQSKRSKSSDS